MLLRLSVGVDGEPAGIPREQVGGGLGVEEAASLVPPDESATDSLGEGVEVAGGDRPGGDELDGVVIVGRVVSDARHEHAVGDARMKMDVVVEGRPEAVEERDAADARRVGPLVGWRGLHACRLTHKPLDFAHEDVRECGDSFGPKPKKPPQTLRHGDHPLPHGDRWNDVIDQVRRGLRHAPAVARWADAPPLAREGHEKIVTAGAAPCPGKPKAENPAAEVAP